MKLRRNSSRKEIEQSLADHICGIRCAEESAVRAVVENIAPFQVFNGDIVRHRIKHST
jgi:hypothetical protein